MLLKRFYDPKLAQASYMIGCQATGEAFILDPNRDTDQYLRAAAEEKMDIRFVSETHIHADYLSGSRQLARRTGASLLLSGDGGPDWQYTFAHEDGATLVHDGDTFDVGNVRIQVFHTPGHTPEHISFMITDCPASDTPLGICTGDFIFVGDVGRPDLLEKAAGVADTMEAGARVLYRSLERFRDMSGHLQVLPGHGAGSACGKALGAVPQSTLGYEHLVNWAFRSDSEDAFVRAVLSDQPEPPAYFANMKRMNRDGPPILDGPPRPPRLGPDALDGVLGAGGTVVDVRSRERFAEGHVPGTLNIQLNGSFPNWSGWFLPYDRPIHLLAESAAAALEAARDLMLIGIDHVAGFFDEEALIRWARHRGSLERSVAVDWREAQRAMEREGAVLVDVRNRTEWHRGHAPEARHIHLGHLPGLMDELPRDVPILLHCVTGARSGIAQSLLLAGGFPDVRNVDGGIEERERLGMAMV